MNSVSLIGNLAKDPELRYTTGQNQTAVGRFTVAVEDGYGDKKRVAWIPVLTFGKQAENCEKYLSKGSQVGVQGRIQTGSYEKDGQRFYTTDVIADRIELLGSASKQSDTPAADDTPADMPAGFAALDDEDIPF